MSCRKSRIKYGQPSGGASNGLNIIVVDQDDVELSNDTYPAVADELVELDHFVEPITIKVYDNGVLLSTTQSPYTDNITINLD